MGFQETFNDRAIPAMDRAFGVAVTLKHGAGVTASFTATWEKKVYQVLDSEGYATAVESRDFMFAKSAAVIGSSTVEPRAGDRVTISDNEVYEVLPLSKDIPAVEEMAGGYRWKVHTKRIA